MAKPGKDGWSPVELAAAIAADTASAAIAELS
jgi:hypothetical protein